MPSETICFMKVFDALKKHLGLRAGSSQWTQSPPRRQSKAPQSQRRVWHTAFQCVITIALETGSNNVKVEEKREEGKQISSRKAVM